MRVFRHFANLPADMRFTTTALFAERSSNRQIAGYPLNSLTQTKFPVYIDKDSYFNPYGNQVAGAGLGHEFLRHVERTRVLIHLVEPEPTDELMFQTSMMAAGLSMPG